MSLEIEVIGDSAFFSTRGKGVCYLLRAGGAPYLIDCGASPFDELGAEGLGELRGVFITHSHEDHKRYFSDIALFTRYALKRKVRLITTATLHDEVERTSVAALTRTLSDDRTRVVDVGYDEFVERAEMGPRELYGVRETPEGLRVVEAATGRAVEPERAKAIVHPRSRRARILFRDPAGGVWVEPESFYGYGSEVFYEGEARAFRDESCGLEVRAVKAAAWHGPPTVGLLVLHGDAKLAFSSDTVFDPGLWEKLTRERREQRLPCPREEFERAPVLECDINDLIERTWSERRLEEAFAAFEGATVVHDADVAGSVVHTSYEELARVGDWKQLLLAHTPDRFVSRHPILVPGKKLLIERGGVREIVSGEPRALDAEIYLKEGDLFYVGYGSDSGRARLWKTKEGTVLTRKGEAPPGAEEEGRFDLFLDLGGRYYSEPAEGEEYFQAADGRVIRYRTEGGGLACEEARDERG